MSESFHPDVRPPDKTEAEFWAGQASGDELFDQVRLESPDEPSLMTEGDLAYQRRIEALVPDEAFLKQPEIERLARTIQAGLAARASLLSDPTPGDAHREELKAEVREGDAARNELVVSHLRFASWVARESMGLPVGGEAQHQPTSGARIKDLASLSDDSTDFADRVQAANIGLMKAAEGYTPWKKPKDGGNRDKPANFRTYAMYQVESQIELLTGKSKNADRLPKHVLAEINKMHRVHDDLAQELGRRPAPEEVATVLDITPQRVAFLTLWAQAQERESIETTEERLQAARDVVATHDDPDDAPQHLTVADRLADPGTSETVEDAVAFGLLQEQIRDVLGELSSREEAIINERFGLIDGNPLTLDQIAKIHGVTRERIRQLEARALTKLRSPNRAKRLRGLSPVESDQYAGMPRSLEAGPATGSGESRARPTVDIRLTPGPLSEADEEGADSRHDPDNESAGEERVETTPEQARNPLEKALLSLDPALFQRGYEWHGTTGPAQTAAEQVTRVVGAPVSAQVVAAFWNEHLEELTRKMTIPGREDELELGRIASTLGVLIASSAGEHELIQLTIPEAMSGRLDRVGQDLSRGVLEIQGDVGHYAGEGARGTARIVIDGNAGDFAGRGMSGSAELQVNGNVGMLAGEGSDGDSYMSVTLSAGEGAGARMSGQAGLHIMGDAGWRLGVGLGGEAMIQVDGRAGEMVGEGATGGSIEVAGEADSIAVAPDFDGTLVVGGARLARNGSEWRPAA